MARLVIANLVVWSSLAAVGVSAFQQFDMVEPVAWDTARSNTPPTPEVRYLRLPATAAADYSEIWERPLFTPERRARVVSEPDAAVPVLAPGVLVAGIVGRSGDLVAVIDAGSESTLRVRAGDTVSGWRVVEVTHSGMTLSHTDGHDVTYPVGKVPENAADGTVTSVEKVSERSRTAGFADLGLSDED